MNILLAISPLIVLFICLVGFRTAAWIAGLIALAVTLIVGVGVWDLSPGIAALSALDAAVLGLWPIWWVIFAAIFTYNLSVRTGAMDQMRAQLSSAIPDRLLQLLFIAFPFGAFLEGVAGFGTSVAIPAGILVSLGFRPVTAAVTCLIANTVPVAFASIGVPVLALANVTGEPIRTLTANIAVQLFVPSIFIPVLIVKIAAKLEGNVSATRRVYLLALASGLTFSVVQYFVATRIGPELPAIAASMATMLFIYAAVALLEGRNSSKLNTLRPWLPFLILILFIVLTRQVEFLRSFLNFRWFVLDLPILPADLGTPRRLDLLYTPGTLMLFAALLGGAFQGARLGEYRETFWRTLRQTLPTGVAVVSMVALASVMEKSGMLSEFSGALVGALGNTYVYFSPVVGAVGTFLTGSDTSSNVLFGAFQAGTARQIGADSAWLAAANAAGATGGKMISPQSLAVAAAAIGMPGEEGALLKRVIPYCILYTVVIALIVGAAQPG